MRLSNKPAVFSVRSCVNRDASFGIHWSHDQHHAAPEFESFSFQTQKVVLDEGSVSSSSDGQLTSTNSSEGSVPPVTLLNCDVEVETCGTVDCELSTPTAVSPLPTIQKCLTPQPEEDDILAAPMSRREFCDSQVAQYRAHLEERRRCQDEIDFHRLHYDAMLGDMYQRHSQPRGDGLAVSVEFEEAYVCNPIDEQAAHNRLNSIRHIIAEGARNDMRGIVALHSRLQAAEGEGPATHESFIRAKYMHRLYWTHVMDDALNLLATTDQTPINTPPSYHGYSTVLNRLSQRQMWRGPVSTCYKLVVEKSKSPKSPSKRRGGYYHGLIKEAESLRDSGLKVQSWKANQEATLRKLKSESLFVA